MRFVQGGESLPREEGMAGDQAIVGAITGGGGCGCVAGDDVAGIVGVVEEVAVFEGDGWVIRGRGGVSCEVGERVTHVGIGGYANGRSDLRLCLGEGSRDQREVTQEGKRQCRDTKDKRRNDLWRLGRLGVVFCLGEKDSVSSRWE